MQPPPSRELQGEDAASFRPQATGGANTRRHYALLGPEEVVALLPYLAEEAEAACEWLSARRSCSCLCG